MEEGIGKIRDALRRRCGEEPFDLALVLGSGLGCLAEEAEGAVSFPYGDFSCFPEGSVSGHAGRLWAGRLAGWRVLLFQGRHHLYQGYDAAQVTVPARVAHALGAPRLLLSNASGGIHPDFRAGDFMFITDHINMLGANPLRGISPPAFIDLSALYRVDLFPPLKDHASEEGIRLHSGVLAGLQGPSYETPAEIRALKLLGADAVSMSTIPEAIMGKYLGMEVAALSLISNVAAGLAPAPLDHEEVLEAGREGARHFSSLVRRMIALWQSAPAPF